MRRARGSRRGATTGSCATDNVAPGVIAQGVEFETQLISDGADGLCTRHRVSPYQIEAAGRPLAALTQDAYSMMVAEQLGSGRKKFVEVEVGNPKPGSGI